MLTAYLLLFIVILILAEFRNLRVRVYFDFLDHKWGRGWYILFIALLVLERNGSMEIGLSLIVMVIAVLNMIIGYNQGSDGKEAQASYG